MDRTQILLIRRIYTVKTSVLIGLIRKVCVLFFQAIHILTFALILSLVDYRLQSTTLQSTV
jgi:hypothetical protein